MSSFPLVPEEDQLSQILSLVPGMVEEITIYIYIYKMYLYKDICTLTLDTAFLYGRMDFSMIILLHMTKNVSKRTFSYNNQKRKLDFLHIIAYVNIARQESFLLGEEIKLQDV